MTEKTIKFLLLFLLFNIVMVGAFNLLSQFNKINPGKNVQISQPPPTSLHVQKYHLESPPVPIALPVNPLPENPVETSNSATNQEDILSQLRNWARKDPEAALVWGQQQTNNDERNEALTDACFQIAQTDPKRAVMLAEQFNLSNDAVLNNLAQQWATKDLTTACNWIVSQPAGDQRDALAAGMTFVWSQAEPVSAAQFVTQQIPPGPAQDEATIMVLHQWAMADLTGANAWAQQFPEGALRERALNELSGIAKYKQELAQSK